MTFANIFSSVVDAKNDQISSIKDQISQLEQLIAEANKKIAYFRDDVTVLELERHNALEAQQSAESALLQIAKAVESIRAYVPEAEVIFRENIDSIFNTEPVAYLNASIEEVETVDAGVIEITEETEIPDENQPESTTTDETDVEVIQEETDSTEAITEPTDEPNDLLPEETKEAISKSKAEMDVEILIEALRSEDYNFIKKAAKIVKDAYNGDFKEHPSLKSPATTLKSYIRSYLPKFKETVEREKGQG